MIYIVTNTATTIPSLAAATLEAAQNAALEIQVEHLDRTDWEFRWEEVDPGREWRLMHRYLTFNKKRFSRTTLAIHAVEYIDS
ncbi:hypothetical protein [Streptomyces roseolus]|uniref:hypothetical protein n=1 Tax=Streptomyces roseolus TaxID=67358 RepID=UPI0037979D9C